jgi:hypothetical protein
MMELQRHLELKCLAKLSAHNGVIPEFAFSCVLSFY